jgi:hypothetical protein
MVGLRNIDFLAAKESMMGAMKAMEGLQRSIVRIDVWRYKGQALLIYSLIAVARPVAAISRAPVPRGQQADSRQPGRMCERCPCKHQTDPICIK